MNKDDAKRLKYLVFRLQTNSRRTSAAAMLDQTIEKDPALHEFPDSDELVRLVRLVDRAGADHHGWNAVGRKPAGLGAERDLGMIVAPGPRLGQADDLRTGRRIESGKARAHQDVDARFRRNRLHLRLEH